jgi:hypothetical protein
MTLPTLNTTGFLITEIAGNWSMLSADLGDGFRLAQNFGLPEGRRSWSVKIDVLPGDGAPLADDLTPGFALLESLAGYVLLEDGVGKIIFDQASTRAAYLWRFFRYSKQRGDQPFWIELEDPETGTRQTYLANFSADKLSYEVLCARVYGTGLELLERRLPPPPIARLRE